MSILQVKSESAAAEREEKKEGIEGTRGRRGEKKCTGEREGRSFNQRRKWGKYI